MYFNKGNKVKLEPCPREMFKKKSALLRYELPPQWNERNDDVLAGGVTKCKFYGDQGHDETEFRM